MTVLAGTEPRSSDPWMQTWSGLAFDVYPQQDGTWTNIRLADIAHALSLQCRFGGHTVQHYSVAEHSVLVALRTWQLLVRLRYLPEARRRVTRGALMHDASECFLVDIPSPWKRTKAFDAYREQESLLQASIALQYECQLDDCEKSLIHQADMEILAVEQRDVMAPCARQWPEMPSPPEGFCAGLWTSAQAEKLFLTLAQELGIED